MISKRKADRGDQMEDEIGTNPGVNLLIEKSTKDSLGCELAFSRFRVEFAITTTIDQTAAD